MAFQSTITRLVETQGSNEERQLIARWRKEIDGFLGTFSPGLLARKSQLALEFPDTLGLGLTVKQDSSSSNPAIALRAREWLPESARAVAEEAASACADGQISLEVFSTTCRYTLLLPRQVCRAPIVQSHYGCPAPPFPPEAIHAWLLSNDISFWLSSTHTPLLLEPLRETTARLENRFRVSLAPQVTELLEQHTWHDSQGWGPVRSGIVLRDVPADLVARLLSGSGLKHFRYLAPYRPYRLLALVLDRSERIEKYVLLP